MATQKTVAIRVAVEDGDKVIAALQQIGVRGDVELRKLEKAGAEASRGLDQAAEGAGRARAAFANVGNQIQDIAVQISSGTDPVRALAQQLPQLASGFGVVGVAIGTAVGIGGALASTLLGAEESAADLAATTDLLSRTFESNTESLGKNLARLGEVSAATRKLIEEQAKLTSAAAVEQAGAPASAIGGVAAAAAERLAGPPPTPTGFLPPAGFVPGLFGSLQQTQSVSSDVKAKLLAAVESGKGADEVERVAGELGLIGPETVADLVELGRLANSVATQKAVEQAVLDRNRVGAGSAFVGGASIPQPRDMISKGGSSGSGPAGGIAEGAAERVAAAQAEAAALTELARASSVSEEAYKAAQVAAAGEAAVRRLGTKATDEQRVAVRKAAEEEERARQGIEASRKARSEEAAATRKAAAETEQAAEKAQREQETREKRLATVQAEVEQLERLRDAHTRGGEAVAEVTAQIAAENEVRAAGLELTSELGQKLYQEALTRAELKTAIDEQTKAEALQVRERERLEGETRRAQERAAAETERLLNRPFENFLDGVQSATTDAFERIYSGGVDSFSDLFTTAKSLAIRFAAEMSTLALFRPGMVFGGAGVGGGAAGVAGGAPGAGLNPLGLAPLLGGSTLGGAFPRLFGAATAPTGAAGAFVPPQAGGLFPGLAGVSLPGLLMSTGLGFAGGSLIGQLIGARGPGSGIGGGVGAGAGFILGSTVLPGLGGPLGAVLGGVGGSLLGSLFGGGSRRDNNFSGTFNPLTGQFNEGTNTNPDQQNVQLVQALAQELATLTAGLKAFGGELDASTIRLKAGGESGFLVGDQNFETLKEAQKAALEAVVGQFSGFSPLQERALANSQATTAQGILADVAVPEQIQQFIRPASSFRAAFDQINTTFKDLLAANDRLDLGQAGGLQRSRQRQLNALRIGARAELGIGETDGFDAAIAAVRAQFAQARKDAELLKVSLGELNKAEALRIQDIQAQQHLAELQSRFDTRNTLIGLGVVELSPLEQALEGLRQQFALAREQADELGVSVERLNAVEAERAQELRDQQRLADLQQRLSTRNQLIGLGVIELSPLEQAIEAVRQQFALAREQAEQLGVSVERLNAVEGERIQQIREEYRAQQQAQLTAARDQAVSAVQGVLGAFEAAIDPIRQFRAELAIGPETGGTGLQRLSATRALFDQAARAAQTGGTTAEEAADALRLGQEVLQLSRNVNSSGGAFQADLRDVNRTLAAIQGQAERDRTAFLATLPTEIRSAADRQVDELRNLQQLARDQVAAFLQLRNELSDLMRSRAA